MATSGTTSFDLSIEEIIQGEKYPDKIGQAKIFKSKWWHRSWPCVKDKGRVSLNIKFIV